MRHQVGLAARRGARRGVGLEQAVELDERLLVEADRGRDRCAVMPASRRQYSTARDGKPASCFLRVNRSSCAAATMRPSSTRQAAESW